MRIPPFPYPFYRAEIRCSDDYTPLLVNLWRYTPSPIANPMQVYYQFYLYHLGHPRDRTGYLYSVVPVYSDSQLHLKPDAYISDLLGDPLSS